MAHLTLSLGGNFTLGLRLITIEKDRYMIGYAEAGVCKHLHFAFCTLVQIWMKECALILCKSDCVACCVILCTVSQVCPVKLSSLFVYNGTHQVALHIVTGLEQVHKFTSIIINIYLVHSKKSCPLNAVKTLHWRRGW